MSNETKQQHTPEPWRVREFPDGSQCFVEADPNNKIKAYGIEILGDDTNEDHYPYEQKKADAERIVSCINAMRWIKDPEEWVINRNKQITYLSDENKELQKYKTACESINKDNPMAVAENLQEMVSILSKCAPALREAGYKTASKQIEELLTKIQSK